MLAKIRRPSSTAETTVDEVVVEKDEVGRLPCHLGAAEAGRDPDVGTP